MLLNKNEIVGLESEPFGFPSVMRSLPFATYLEIEALNSHGATTILDESPYHFRYEREHPAPSTKAKTAGTLVHEMILEPEKKGYLILPKGGEKSSKAGLTLLLDAYCEWLDTTPPPSEETAPAKIMRDQVQQLEQLFESDPRYLVTEEQMENAKATRENVFRREAPGVPGIAETLFADGDPELTLLWEDSTGCKKKARADWMPASHEIILDVKSIDRAGNSAIERAIRNFNYDFQGQFYIEGTEACGLGKRVFVILFVERNPPFHSRLKYFSDKDMADASRRNQHAAKLYHDAMTSGYWPSYPQTIDPIIMSKYRYSAM